MPGRYSHKDAWKELVNYQLNFWRTAVDCAFKYLKACSRCLRTHIDASKLNVPSFVISAFMQHKSCKAMREPLPELLPLPVKAEWPQLLQVL